VFGGTLDGDNHVVVPGVTAGWKAWQDITVDNNNPAVETAHIGTTFQNRFIYGDNWYGGTFTPLNAHAIKFVWLMLGKYGNPGDLTVEIYATADGKPTGNPLTSGTVAAADLATLIAEKTIELTPYNLAASTLYAIVCRCTGDASNYVFMRTDTDAGYANGTEVYSTDGGDTWVVYTLRDLVFKEGPGWTWPAVQSLDCDVEQNDVSKGNTMYVGMVQIQVTYTPSGPTPGWYPLQFTEEPPTPNAWNQIKQEAGVGYVKILFEGE